MRGTSGTDGTKTSALYGYIVPSVPPVPFHLWNGTTKERPINDDVYARI